MKYRLIIILIWIAGILFPMHAMRRFNSRFKEGFDLIFSTHASHVVMHALLFAVLAFLLFNALSHARNSRRRVGITLLIVLCIAILQESIQVMTAGVSSGHDERFDILIDTLGALVGVSVASRRHAQDAQESP